MTTGSYPPRRVFDYESRSAYKVVVTAADQGARTDVVRVSIEIQDIDEPPDFDTTSPTLTVAENTATDTTTGKTVGSPVTVRIPVKPATQSGESGHPVGAKATLGIS